MKKYLILIILIGPRLHTKEIETYYVDYNTGHHGLSILGNNVPDRACMCRYSVSIYNFNIIHYSLM